MGCSGAARRRSTASRMREESIASSSPRRCCPVSDRTTTRRRRRPIHSTQTSPPCSLQRPSWRRSDVGRWSPEPTCFRCCCVTNTVQQRHFSIDSGAACRWRRSICLDGCDIVAVISLTAALRLTLQQRSRGRRLLTRASPQLRTAAIISSTAMMQKATSSVR